MVGRTCAERAKKYAAKLAIAMGLSGSEEAGIEAAYRHDCEQRWESNTKAGLKAYAKMGGR
jgi:hypothetical protein